MGTKACGAFVRKITGAAITGASLLITAAVAPVYAQPVPVAPYTISQFALSDGTTFFDPDSVTYSRAKGKVWIGYGNGGNPDGSGGAQSTIVEYDLIGNVKRTFTVAGHNDGLKFQPSTGLVWAMQNEDANPNLVIIDPALGTKKIYNVTPTAHGGGYDDIVFVDDKVYFSASNPANNPNNGPAVVRLTSLSGTTATVAPAFLGTDTAFDVATQTHISLNLQDPDSMISDPFGDIVLDSQADHEIIIKRAAGTAGPRLVRIPVSLAGAGSVEINDTVFVDAIAGQMLITDTDGQTTYSLKTTYWAPGKTFSAADANGAVGPIDLATGIITPVVTGLVHPNGLLFIPASAD